MFRKYLITLSVVFLFSLTSLVFAGEMEKWGIHDISQPVNMGIDFDHYQTSIPNFTNAYPKIDSRIDNHVPKTYMKPFLPDTAHWDDMSSKYIHREIQRDFLKSVANPSDIYVEKKLENDVLRGINTMVSIGTATVGGPLSKIGAVNNFIHNFGPQKGASQNITGYVGDAISTVNILKTGKDVIGKNFSNAGIGAVGIMNSAFGKIIDVQKNRLMEPVTISNVKYYQFKTNDGFTRIDGRGTISVSKTYTPPKTIKPFGPPGIFDGSTKTITKQQSVTRIQTGNFNNNSFRTNIYKMPRIKSYQTPRFSTYNNFRTHTFTAPKFRPSFRTPSFRFNSFGGIR